MENINIIIKLTEQGLSGISARSYDALTWTQETGSWAWSGISDGASKASTWTQETGSWAWSNISAGASDASTWTQNTGIWAWSNISARAYYASTWTQETGSWAWSGISAVASDASTWTQETGSWVIDSKNWGTFIISFTGSLEDNKESALAASILKNETEVTKFLLNQNEKFSKFDFKNSKSLLTKIVELYENQDVRAKIEDALKPSKDLIFTHDNLMHVVYNSQEMKAFALMFIEKIKTFAFNEALESPLSHALLSGKDDLVQLLLQNNSTAKFSKFDFTRIDNNEFPKLLLSKIAEIMESDADFAAKIEPALNLKDYSNNPVNYLLDYLYSTSYSYTSLILNHQNMMHVIYNSEKMPKLLSSFLKNNFVINPKLESPLSHALLSGKTELVKLLLENESTAKFSEFDFTRDDNDGKFPKLLLSIIGEIMESDADFAAKIEPTLKDCSKVIQDLHNKVESKENQGSSKDSQSSDDQSNQDPLDQKTSENAHKNLMNIIYANSELTDDVLNSINSVRDNFVINNELESPLSHALLSGKTELVKLLLENESTAKFSEFDFTRDDNDGKFPKLFLSIIGEIMESDAAFADKIEPALKEFSDVIDALRKDVERNEDQEAKEDSQDSDDQGNQNQDSEENNNSNDNFFKKYADQFNESGRPSEEFATICPLEENTSLNGHFNSWYYLEEQDFNG